MALRGGSGPQLAGAPPRVNYPAECFLPIRTLKYGGERVIDFSNPLTVKLERARAYQWVAGQEKDTGRAEMDFADWWDWPWSRKSSTSTTAGSLDAG